jgi:hypothetical protein
MMFYEEEAKKEIIINYGTHYPARFFRDYDGKRYYTQQWFHWIKTTQSLQHKSCRHFITLLGTLNNLNVLDGARNFYQKNRKPMVDFCKRWDDEAK